MKGQDIIIVGHQPWDIEIGSNCKNIALEFAKENRVLYVNFPLDRITSFKDRRKENVRKRLKINKGEVDDLQTVQKNLWTLYPKMIAESINWIGNATTYDLMNRFNNKRLANAIKDAIHRLGFKDFILFNDSMMFRGLHLKEMLKPKTFVYYIRDYLICQPYFQKHGPRIEPKIIKKADVVVANSTFLSDYGKKHNPNSHYVGQGCDLTAFDQRKTKKRPDDIPTGKPVVGYVGYLTAMRLDVQLLVKIAKQRPNINLVLVGPEDETFQNSQLHKLENAHFLGPKNPEELPSYVQHFDVCINPQVLNDLTIGNYPRKIDEYLSLGKPTVATRTTAMEVFEGHTYLAKNTKEFISLIDKALKDKDPSSKNRRKRFARKHTWENSVKSIYKHMETVLQTVK